MTKVDLGGGWGSTVTSAGEWSPVSCGTRHRDMSTTFARRTQRHGGTLADLWVYIMTAGTGTRNFTVRQNGSDTALAINITGTGEFADASTVTMTAGDDFEYESDTTGDNMVVRGHTTTLDVSGGKSTVYAIFFNGQVTSTAGQGNIVGYSDTNTSIGTNGITFQEAGTFTNAAIYASAHTSNQNVTFDVNGSTSAINITVSGTGEFEDASDVVISADDEVEWEWTSSGNVTLQTALLEFTSSGDNLQFYSCDSGTRATAANNYSPVFGEISTSTDVLIRQTNIQTTCTAANYFCYVSTANSSADTEFQFDKNGSNESALTLAVDGGTGRFEDSTGSVSLVDGDLIESDCSVGTSTCGLNAVGMVLEYPSDVTVQTKTFTIDVVIQKPSLTKTFTIDTVIQKPSLTKTFTMDVHIIQRFTKTFTIDTVIQKPSLTKTFTIDTVIQKELTKTFTIDVIIQKELTKTFTIDVVLTGGATATKTFTIDTVIQKPSLTKTFTIDVIIQKPSLTKTFTIDTVLQKELTKTFTIDVVIQKPSLTKTFTMDVIIQEASLTKTFTMDTILQKEITKTFTIDVVIKALSVTKTFTIDVVISLVAPVIITKVYSLFMNKLTHILHIGELTHTNFLNSKSHRVYLRE